MREIKHKNCLQKCKTSAFSHKWHLSIWDHPQWSEASGQRPGERLPALRTYLDDVMSILQIAPCTARLLKLMMILPRWAHRQEWRKGWGAIGQYTWQEERRADFWQSSQFEVLVESILLTSSTNRWGRWCRSSWLMAWQGLTAANCPGNSKCGATNSHCSSVLRGHWETASPASLYVRPGIAKIYIQYIRKWLGLPCCLLRHRSFWRESSPAPT